MELKTENVRAHASYIAAQLPLRAQLIIDNPQRRAKQQLGHLRRAHFASLQNGVVLEA